MKTAILRGIIIGVLIAGAITMRANANPLASPELQNAIAPSTAMTEGKYTMAPLGHIILCMKNPSACKTSSAKIVTRKARTYLRYIFHSKPARTKQKLSPTSPHKKAEYAAVKLTPKTWAQLFRANKKINTRITPRFDGKTRDIDIWSLSGTFGDCEDYALQKRQTLMHMGWPAHSVLLTIAEHPRYGAHAVLVARTSNGDFVLDNLRERVVPWNRAGYRWIKRQSRSNPAKWVHLSGAALPKPGS